MSGEKKRASGKHAKAKAIPAPKDFTRLNSVVDGYLKHLGAYLALTAAIERSGFDVSPCRNCGEPVVCIPDGLAMCRECAEKAAKEG